MGIEDIDATDALRSDVKKKVERLAQEEYKDVLPFIEAGERLDRVEMELDNISAHYEIVERDSDQAEDIVDKLREDLHEAYRDIKEEELVSHTSSERISKIADELDKAEVDRKEKVQITRNLFRKMIDLHEERRKLEKILGSALEVAESRINQFADERRELEKHLLPPFRTGEN